MGPKRNAYRLLVGNPEGKKPLGRPRRRWVDNIKMNLIGWSGMDWIDLAQDRDQWRALVNTVMNLRFPWNAGKFLNSCVTDGFSRRAQLHEVRWLASYSVTLGIASNHLQSIWDMICNISVTCKHSRK
jgi:hypothetical protein